MFRRLFISRLSDLNQTLMLLRERDEDVALILINSQLLYSFRVLEIYLYKCKNFIFFIIFPIIIFSTIHQMTRYKHFI